MVPVLLELAIEFHRAPLRFPHLSDPARPLPADFGDRLVDSSAALTPGTIQATAHALRTDPETLRESFLFLLRQVLLSPAADHYRVLGLSRHCPAESIKQHHSLLVGMFHPDRSPEHDERRVSLTARINGAYQTLRDPQTRRDYDLQLGPVPQAPPAGAKVQDWLGAGTPVVATPRTQPPRQLPARRPLFWMLTALGAAVVVFTIAREPHQPALRINPDLADPRAAGGPSYLGRGTETSDAKGSSSARGIAPAQAPTLERDDLGSSRPTAEKTTAGHALPMDLFATIEPSAVQSTRPAAEPRAPAPAPARVARESTGRATTAPSPVPKVPPRSHLGNDGQGQAQDVRSPIVERRQEHLPPTDRQPAPDAARANAVSTLLNRLEGSIASGDLPGLAGLFTANAIVDDGAGIAAVRSQYARHFSAAGQHRMTISAMKWHEAEHQRLVGRGAIRVRTRSGPGADWQETAGTIELELVPWMGDYRIAKMIRRLPQR